MWGFIWAICSSFCYFREDFALTYKVWLPLTFFKNKCTHHYLLKVVILHILIVKNAICHKDRTILKRLFQIVENCDSETQKFLLVENGSSLNIVNLSDNNCRLKWQEYHIDKNKDIILTKTKIKNKFYLLFKMFTFINGQ